MRFGRGLHARRALAPLIDMLSDPDPSVCHLPVYALGEIGLAKWEVLAALLRHTAAAAAGGTAMGAEPDCRGGKRPLPQREVMLM